MITSCHRAVRVASTPAPLLALRACIIPSPSLQCTAGRPAAGLANLRQPSRGCYSPLVRAHSTGHGRHHGHHHHVDDVNSSSSGSSSSAVREGTNVTLVGLASNAGLVALKTVGGAALGSAALVADGVHSLSDMVADAVALVSYRRARAKRDGRTPSYGHGKAEPLGALGVSLVLLGAGAGAAWHSVSLLLPPLGAAVAEAGAHSHSTALMTLEDPVFATAALAIAAGSVVAKELLFRWTLRVGEAQKSQVLIANAWHHRADSWSGLVALVGVAGANCGVLWLDPACGLVVSGLIVKASIDMIKPALSELLDEVDTEVVEQVKHILHSVAKSDKNIVAFHTIRARKMGPETFVDFQVQVNPRITVSLAHQISENARHAIVSALPAVAEVLVHVDVDPPAHNAASPAATEHPTSHIERQIMDSVLPDLIPLGVDRFAHFKVHYLNGGMEIEAEIILSDCSDKMLFKDAVKLAHAVRERLLEYPGVVAADVHLETDDRHSA